MHQVRKSLRYVPWKERKPVAGGLRSVYTAPSEEAALTALEAFEQEWSEKYPAIAPLWRKDWERLAPFFDYAPAIRKVVYTTNAIESLNYSLRKIVKGRGAFPNDDAVRKLLYLGLREASKKWKRPIRDWKAEMVRKNWTVFFVFLSVLSRRVMPPGSAVFVCRIRRRGFGCQVPGEAALR